MKFPDAKVLGMALHLVDEAQRLLENAELRIPAKMVPQLLRDLADRIEKQTYVKYETNSEVDRHP